MSEWTVEEWDRAGYWLLGAVALAGLWISFAFVWYLLWFALVALITRRVIRGM